MPPALAGTTPPSPASKRQRELDFLGSENEGGHVPSSNASAGSLPGTIPTAMIPSFLNKSRSDIAALFQELEWKQRFRLSHALTHNDSPFRVDLSPAVINRNRYGNVQPWDGSRVKLKNPVGGSDYVNASPITLKSRSNQISDTGHNSQTDPLGVAPAEAGKPAIMEDETKYIATQGPKDGQFLPFWQMVMQETVGDIGVIVMLTTVYEGNRKKCAQYFPISLQDPTISLIETEESGEHASGMGDPFSDSSPMSADADSFDTEQNQTDKNGNDKVLVDGEKHVQHSDGVTLLSLVEDSLTGSQIRKLQLQIGEDNKTIYHYLFDGWPDYGKPDVESRKTLLELIKQSAARAGRKDNPRFVHCSAGVGRTGTFIALDYLLQELDNGVLINETNENATTKNSKTSTWGRSGVMKESTPEAKEDIIYETVDKLREQRMMMVTFDSQYSFLYEVLKEAFIAKYAKRPSGPVITDAEPVTKVPRKQKETATEEAEEAGEEEPGSEAETDIVEDDDKKRRDPHDVATATPAQ